MRRDSFLRCYLEAWVYWIILNVVFTMIDYGRAQWMGENVELVSITRLGQFTDLFLLVAQGILLIPLFAAILVGIRRNTASK